jgi:hypothetical protein
VPEADLAAVAVGHLIEFPLDTVHLLLFDSSRERNLAGAGLEWPIPRFLAG